VDFTPAAPSCKAASRLLIKSDAGHARSKRARYACTFALFSLGSKRTLAKSRISPGAQGGGLCRGQNIAIEYRFADNQLDQLSELAADLVCRRVAVIMPGRAKLATNAHYAGRKTAESMRKKSPTVAAGLLLVCLSGGFRAELFS